MRDSIITIVAVILAFSALDDISTDTDASFAVEYTALVICGIWFAYVSWRTHRRGRRSLGNVSIGVTVALALAQFTLWLAIGPGQWVAYVVTLIGLGWFAVLGGILVWSDRSSGAHATP